MKNIVAVGGVAFFMLLNGCNPTQPANDKTKPGHFTVTVDGADDSGYPLLLLCLTNNTGKAISISYRDLPDQTIQVALIETARNNSRTPRVICQSPAIFGRIRDRPVGNIVLRSGEFWTNRVSLSLFYGTGWEQQHVTDEDHRIALLWSYQLITFDSNAFSPVSGVIILPERRVKP